MKAIRVVTLSDEGFEEAFSDSQGEIRQQKTSRYSWVTSHKQTKISNHYCLIYRINYSFISPLRQALGPRSKNFLAKCYHTLSSSIRMS